MPPLNLNDAESIKTLIVDPVVKGVRDEMGAQIAALQASDKQQQADIDTLKRNQSRALLGMSGLTLAGTALASVAWDRIKKAIGWG